MATIPSGTPSYGVQFPPPPLPPGWSEHQAAGGQSYYYHAATNQSTYTRPLPNMPFPGPAVPYLPQAIVPGAAPTKEKKKKEKPLVKTPIPETPWLRVKTTEGNIFYTHKERKESVWEVPDEIKEQVVQLEMEEKEKEEKEKQEKLRQREDEREEAEAERKRKEFEEMERVKQEVEGAVASGKRKASELAAAEGKAPFKKSRVEEEMDNQEFSEETQSERDRTEPPQALLEEKSSPDSSSTPRNAASKAFNVQERVNLSIDEAKALFKTLLQEKNINPLHPWDTSLPFFINDPRYVLLPSVSVRREVFDEYCRDTLRVQRAAKAAALKAEAAATSSTGDKDMDAYMKLLKDEVSSTRTSWHEFKRKWKKDRRFFGWASDRDRERAFRNWLRHLGEEKKKQAEKAELEFFQLLKESSWIKTSDMWKDVKRKINPKDPRYDAVGSSSLREELFNTYTKTLDKSQLHPSSSGSMDHSPSEPNQEIDTVESETFKRKQRSERSIREREEKVHREREDLERQLNRTRGAVSREEGEREFLMLLTDAIRDPQAIWDSSVQSLSKDPRFILCALPLPAQKELFTSHVSRIREKYLKMLHGLFAAHTPSINARWVELDESTRRAIRRSLPVTKLGLYPESDGKDSDSDDDMIRRRSSDRDIESEFEKWQRVRNADARRAFDEMLGENAFVEFWGRMNKAGEAGTDIPGVEEEEEAEGEGSGGKADLKKLAKSIDIGEVAVVLKHDSRWAAFNHVPEQRERWLRAHMEHLVAPKLSVHVPEKDRL